MASKPLPTKLVDRLATHRQIMRARELSTSIRRSNVDLLAAIMKTRELRKQLRKQAKASIRHVDKQLPLAEDKEMTTTL